MQIAATDPSEAILTEAEGLGVLVFSGVAMYAWCEYCHGSLVVDERVAKERWEV